MSAFWSNLHRISQDQLFFGGYVSRELAVEINENRERKVGVQSDCDKHADRQMHWPRLAAPH